MDEPSITLHSSWRGITMSTVGALAVLLIGALAVSGNGFVVLPTLILALGTLMVCAVVFDYPVASTFTPDAVVRRAMLRSHRIEWDRVDQLTRARPSLTSGLRQLKPGGLTAKVGRRRYLLVDQCESMSEFDELSEILEGRFVELAIDEMIVPPDSTDPTWTYRRKHWARPFRG
ncbi:MAG: hypothetical protein HKN44_11430 [Ilumatobacter sp.]|nr:hypothetical protein [Ilumatobacter sp.]